jgi:restriction system protein
MEDIMARRSGFLSTTIRLAKAIEVDSRRAQNAAIREHNAQVRNQQKLQREYERTEKQAERERLIAEKEDAIQYAIDKTNESEEKRLVLSSLIKETEQKPIEFSWNQFKKHDSFSDTEPNEPKYKSFPNEINTDDYKALITFIDKVFKSRKQKKIEEAQVRLQKAIEYRTNEVTEILSKNASLKKEFENQYSSWKNRKEEFEKAQNEFNEEIDRQEKAFYRNEQEYVELYFDTILSSSNLPEELRTSWIISYEPTSKILIIDYDLPDRDIIPQLKTMKYMTTRKEFTETLLKDKDLDLLYDEILFQLCLRITHDIYVSDISDQIISIVFNGIYTGVNKGSGKEETKCIMTLQTKKNDFQQISIQNVEAKSCFLKFKGISGAKLSECVPVAPILQFNKEDSRFVEAKDVSGIINGTNLASMDWEDFEHLIREIFEKEFAINGSEIKITQASRDGGVDAVMFDPDPIRGGKYIIQAKRYTNVVGVSAVRDLYGTLMNEGAVKGILVTTANYGADSYEFAKDKPITLINGNNLLHMLQKHGYEARIDIEEAKKTLTENK